MVNILKTKKINCSPKLGHTIQIPRRTDVLGIMRDLEPQVVNVLFPIQDLIELLGEFIAGRFRVDVVGAVSNDVDIEDININAYYDPDLDERKKVSIELVLITNPNATHLMLDEIAWMNLCLLVADSLAHELIHMRSFRARGFEDVAVKHATAFNELPDTQEYLADPDEIEAYAYNIAQELLAQKNPLAKLSDLKSVSISDSLNLFAYVQTFDKDAEHPVMKRLLKKIYKHLKKT
jgi:hypothetical protein